MSRKGSFRHEIVQNKRIKNVEKRVRKLQSEIETKYVDVFIQSLLDDSGLSSGTLNYPVTQGPDADSDMIGNEIFCTRLRMRGFISTPLEGVFSPSIRFILFWDTKPSLGTTWLADDLIDTDVIASSLLAPFRHSTVGPGKRFNIIMDRQFSLMPGGPLWSETTNAFVGNQEKIIDLNFDIPLNRKTIYDRERGSSDVDQWTKNTLWYWIISDAPSAGPASSKPQALIGSRVFYRDA